MLRSNLYLKEHSLLFRSHCNYASNNLTIISNNIAKTSFWSQLYLCLIIFDLCRFYSVENNFHPPTSWILFFYFCRRIFLAWSRRIKGEALMAKHSPEPTAVNESCLDVNAVTDEELLLCFLVRHNFGAFWRTFCFVRSRFSAIWWISDGNRDK